MKNSTLLLVDDEPAILGSLRRVFRGQGCRILTAGDGEKALSILGEEPVDVILTDHLMPGMTGIQLLREAKRRAPNVFRLLVSAYVDTESILSASNAGVVQRFIMKPFVDEDVRAAVQEFLERRQVRERRDFLEALIESCPDPIVITDMSGRVTYVNSPASEFRGEPPERLIGTDVGEMFAQRDTEVEAIRALLKREGRVRSYETEILTHRGAVPINLSMAPLLDAKGRRQGFFGIAKDISQCKRVEAELRSRNLELAALNHFASAAMRRLDPESILDRAIEVLVQVSEVQAAGLYLYDAEDACFRLRAHRGIGERQAAPLATVSHSFLGRYPEGDALVVHSGEALQATEEGRALAREGFGMAAYTRILWNGEVKALLVIARRDALPLNDSIARLLPAIGAMAGTWMENSLLFERTKSVANRAALLHGISSAAQNSLDVEEVLDSTARWTATALHVDRALVALFREDLSGLETCRGLGGSWGPADSKEPGITPACLAEYRAEGALVVDDIAKDPTATRCLPSSFRRGLQAFVEAPLLYQEELLGVLQVGASSPRRWKREEIGLLEDVALELALAVRHARTVRELRRTLDALETANAAAERRAEETTALYRLSRALTHVLDFDDLVALTAESVLTATRARAAAVIVNHRGRAHAALLACGEVEDEETGALREAIADAAQTILGRPPDNFDSAPIRSAGACVLTEAAASTEEVPRAPDLVIPFGIKNREAGLFWIRPHGKQPFAEWEKKLARTIALQTASTLERLLDAIDTERRKIEAMVEGMIEPVVLLDESFSVLCMNASARRLLDLEHPQARFDPSRVRPPSLRRMFLRAARDREDALLEEDILFEGPAPRVFHVALSPVADGAGRRIGTAALFHDVTARREVEQMKSEFVANVSHELRTPLTSIKESIALLLDGVMGAISEGQRDFLEIADRETNRLVRLINDVLELSRIESSRVRLRRSFVSPQVIARSVIESVEIAAERAGVRLSLDAPEGLRNLLADPDRITQILLILMDNAIKFTAGEGSVTVSIADGPDAVAIRVSDTGCGIPESELERIFETFHQVPQDGVPQGRGTGLGLSIAKRLIEMHRGTIRAESRLGEGSTFTIMLPRMDASRVVEEYLEGQMIRARAEEYGIGLISVVLETRGKTGPADATLREGAGDVLRRALFKPGDRVFPHGPDRFLIVIDHTQASGVRTVQLRLAAALREGIQGPAERWTATWSTAVYPDDGVSPAELLEAVGVLSPGPAEGGVAGPPGSSPST